MRTVSMKTEILLVKESPETAQNVQPSGETSLSSVDMSIERLRDFDYLLSNFIR